MHQRQQSRGLMSVLSQPFTLGLLILVALSASRVLLCAIFWNRVTQSGGLGFIIAQGIRFDLILVGMLIGPVVLFKPFFHASQLSAAMGKWLWSIYLAAVAAFIFFVEASTLSFLREYGSRPNYTFVEYLAFPRELLATLTGSHLAELIALTLGTVIIFWAVANWSRANAAALRRVKLSHSLLVFPLSLVVVVAMIRSTLDHRPVNPSIAAFSEDGLVNDLALNSPYSLLYAIYEQRRDGTGHESQYGEMAEGRAISVVLSDAGITQASLTHEPGPTVHVQEAARTFPRPLNLVIILEESLGAEFVGTLGGKDLTPRLDDAAGTGIWFENLYATGTRSARGIEAVITGITPTTRQSVVKLSETQHNFFTLAALLEQQDYQTSFIYGGEAHFDNMKRFFLNNGFHTVIDEKDFTHPAYLGAWGVSDEDLFNRAHEWFVQQGDRPFFSLVFTSSNHDPFDIPAGRVVPEPGADGARETAVKYADFALGQYLETARRSNYWTNTVFLVIADHNSRVYGDQLVPIERFHIPGLILGGSIEPRHVPGITSQIDMPPTLLSLIGVSAAHPGIGHDLTQPLYRQGAGRAMMQFDQTFAYMVPGEVVILQPDLPEKFFSYQPGGGLAPDPSPHPGLLEKALAYSVFGNAVIRQHWYYNHAP